MTLTTHPPTAEVPPDRPYHLTAEQIRFFDENGYLVLPGRIAGDLLTRLQAAASRWIEDGQAVHDDAEDHGDYSFAERPTGTVMFRVDYLHAKHEAASLELLGSPEMLGVAESLAGPNAVPTYESLVFKNAGDGAPIAWHQDAVHPRRHRIFNVDVYLDASRAGEGALRVVPGSHRGVEDVCALRDAYGWEPPGVVQVELEAGDVLLHDVMIVHGSEPVRHNPLRRTLYYEFRSAEQILSEGPWDRAWVDARMKLLPLALAEHARRRPDVEQFHWRVTDDLRPAPSADVETELRLVHLVSDPGSFCSAGDVERDEASNTSDSL